MKPSQTKMKPYPEISYNALFTRTDTDRDTDIRTDKV